MTIQADIRNIEARIARIEAAIEAGHMTDDGVLSRLRSQLAVLVGVEPEPAPKPKKKRTRKKKKAITEEG